MLIAIYFRQIYFGRKHKYHKNSGSPLDAGNEAGLEVNAEITKHIFVSFH